MSKLHSSLHHPVARSWLEPSLRPKHLIYPLFVSEKSTDADIKGFFPNKQWGIGENKKFSGLVDHISELVAKGLKAVMLFGVVEDKDAVGTAGDRCDTPVIVAGSILRETFPELLICFDVCLCEYTDHGHCGHLRNTPLEEEPLIDNEATIKRLASISLSYAKAGAHVLCPSDMMDGRISLIRETLDSNGYQHVSIMAYTSKKASVMYAPFRDAVDSTFKGNRKQYQQPTGSSHIAHRAYERDINEGADSIIVKPCLFYGDIIQQYASKSPVPVVAYVVSGEYKMLYDYGESTGSMESVLQETHVGLLRAGVSVIITYFTPVLLDYLKEWS